MTIVPSPLKVFRWWLAVTVMTTVGLLGTVGGLALAANGAGYGPTFSSISWICVIASAVVVVLTTFASALLVSPQGARLQFDNEALVFRTRFNERAYRWSDVTGFQVGGNPFLRCVTFAYTPEYRANRGDKRVPSAKHINGMLPGYFTVAPHELVAILNQYKQHSLLTAGDESASFCPQTQAKLDLAALAPQEGEKKSGRPLLRIVAGLLALFLAGIPLLLVVTGKQNVNDLLLVIVLGGLFGWYSIAGRKGLPRFLVK